MNSIKFNDLYKQRKNISYKHYLNYYFQNYLFSYIILILLILLLFYYKKLNIYKLILVFTLFIIFFVYYFFPIYVNRANKCFILSKEIINNINIKPIETKPSLLDKPFKEFYVNSSHNSFIPCNQNLDIVSLNSLKKVLLMGARCIEIDIHEKNGLPIVAHGTDKILTTTYLPLEDCIDVINKYGFKTSDPLVLFIEVVTKNDNVLKKISEIVKKKFGDRLLSNEYKINKSKRFIDEPIKNLLNKIIIVNSSFVYNNLEDILDDDTLNNINNGDSNSLVNNNNYMRRVYSYPRVCLQFSCNYDPIVHWKNRANFVALNFQTLDKALLKNYTLFKDYSFVHFSEISFD